MGDVIAERVLYLNDIKKIRIVIGHPQFISEQYGYFCPYRIIGGRNRKLRRAPGGLDALHAIQLAMEKIAMDIYLLNEANGNALRWEGGSSGDTGLPLSDRTRVIMEKGNR